MRSPASLGLVSILIGSAASAVAQSTPPGVSITRSMADVTARAAYIEQTKPVDPEWLRVTRLPPGTELLVRLGASRREHRLFLWGDERELTVLNPGGAALPAAATNVLQELAATHSEYFRDAQQGGRYELGKSVRLGPDGVFVADRKVADLAQLIERYLRSDITEIALAASQSNPLGCALAGYFGGGLIGGLPGVVIGGAVGGDTGPALLGMTAGWALGSVYIYRSCRHRPERVIYFLR